MADEVKVTLTLRKSAADRLRDICYAKKETASSIIDRWILQNGSAEPKQKTAVDGLMDMIGIKR